LFPEPKPNQVTTGKNMFFNKHKKKSSCLGAGCQQPKVDNPYLNAREEWLERYGNYISRAAQWRMMAFICLGTAMLSTTGNILQIKQAKITPYIVELDQLGRTNNVSKIESGSAVPQKMIQSAVADAILNWRTVTADTDLQKKMVSRLSFFTTGAAKGLLKQWYADNNPYEIAKAGKLINVEVKGLPLPVSSESYRIEWSETIRSHTGTLLEQNFYEATAAIQIVPPATDEMILQNPGGIYIMALSAAKISGQPGEKK
jgi:type IV secretion system protein VirB5